MSAGGAADAALARATELYAEGMAFEDANETQLALDRYRRAVKMADERQILARLAAMHPDMMGPGPSAPTPEAKAPDSRPSAEEEFELWRAMHISKLEAGADASPSSASAPSASAPNAATQQPASAAPPQSQAAFKPPPRRPAVAQEDVETELEAEEADRMAVRALQRRLKPGEGQEAPPAALAAVAGDSESPLLGKLGEVLPTVLAFFDAYSLDRAAPACGTLCRLSRGCPTWASLGKRCLPDDAVASPSSPSRLEEKNREWRSLLLAHHRLRTDGIYIAACGYRRRIPKGSSLTDSRESMWIQYHRLIRALPEEDPTVPKRQVLVLTYEGDLAQAVEALKLHPAGRTATFGNGAKVLGEVPGPLRKIQLERVNLAEYSMDCDRVVTVRFTDVRNEHHIELSLSDGRKNGSRNNSRLTWLRYDFTSVTVPEDGGSFDLRREKHYAPFAFSRVRALEHLF